MPDAALQSTERQFRELLAAASPNRELRLRMFELSDVPRGEAGRSYMRERCEDIGNLWDANLDGLIVTGTEPRAAVLADEPYWEQLTSVVDWAESHSTSTVFSCLAAHAAVYHLDGIERTPFPTKLAGVFESQKMMEHEIVAGMPARWRVPHSRQNTLAAGALTAAGYDVLSSSPQIGADLFVKQTKSLFLFVQGHPEYDPRALLREYVRDVGKFLRGERDRYPEVPAAYFDTETAAAVEGFRRRAQAERDVKLLDEFPTNAAPVTIANPWRQPAVRLYANWLSYLGVQRAGRDNRARPGKHTARIPL